MNRTANLLAILLLIFVVNSCRKTVPDDRPYFEDAKPFPITAGIIDEASGLADSYANAGFLWVNQDSDNPTKIYLLGHDGKHGKSIHIDNVTNRDWEEIMVGDGPTAGKKYVYIGDIGDNQKQYDEYFIYRFEEPFITTDTVKSIDKIRFKYDDGRHDAEAFFIDAAKNIYIIIKTTQENAKVYQLSYPYSTTSLNTATYIATLSYTGVVGASYNSSGELLVKTYNNIFYYQSNQSVLNTLKGSYSTLSYQIEPQGEAISFANNGSGFYTLSEKAFASLVNLNYYKRK